MKVCSLSTGQAEERYRDGQEGEARAGEEPCLQAVGEDGGVRDGTGAVPEDRERDQRRAPDLPRRSGIQPSTGTGRRARADGTAYTSPRR